MARTIVLARPSQPATLYLAAVWWGKTLWSVPSSAVLDFRGRLLSAIHSFRILPRFSTFSVPGLTTPCCLLSNYRPG